MAFAAPAPIGEFALRVLVCEDDAAQRELIATWLAAEGVIVETAEDGREALERARATPPDAIVADWLMPGLDGITLVGGAAGRPRARRRLHRRRHRPRGAGVRAPRGRRRRRPRPGQAARARGPRRGRRRRRAPRAGPAPPPGGLPHRSRPPACATPARCARTPSGMLAVARSTGVPVCLAICDTDGRAPGGLAALVRSIGLALGPADAIYRLDDDDPGTLAVLAPDCDEPDLLVAALVAAGADAGEVLRAGASVATAGSPSRPAPHRRRRRSCCAPPRSAARAPAATGRAAAEPVGPAGRTLDEPPVAGPVSQTHGLIRTPRRRRRAARPASRRAVRSYTLRRAPAPADRRRRPRRVRDLRRGRPADRRAATSCTSSSRSPCRPAAAR